MPTGVTAAIGTNPDATFPVIVLIGLAAAIVATTPPLVDTFGSSVTSTPFTLPS